MRIHGLHGCTAALLVTCLTMFGSGAAYAAKDKIVFATPPTQTLQQTIKLYGPIADYLSKATGKKVVLATPDTFLKYTNDMRANKYDLVFDGPHFSGWRIDKEGQTALVRVPGAIRFVVVVRDDAGVRKVGDLAGKKVCSFASPNLLTMGFLDLFPNPARLPIMVKAESPPAALKCVRSDEAPAAVMRDIFWNKRKPAQKKGLTEIYASKVPWPGRTFTISKEVGQDTRDKIKAALLSDQGALAAKNVLASFRAKHFIPAKDEDYKGLGKLLKPVWGFY